MHAGGRTARICRLQDRCMLPATNERASGPSEHFLVHGGNPPRHSLPGEQAADADDRLGPQIVEKIRAARIIFREAGSDRIGIMRRHGASRSGHG